jgi:hypothetical protein
MFFRTFIKSFYTLIQIVSYFFNLFRTPPFFFIPQEVCFSYQVHCFSYLLKVFVRAHFVSYLQHCFPLKETVAHIQSAWCKAQRKIVIGAHNRCWKYLLCAITKHGEAQRDFEFIGEDKDRQLESLWRETKIGGVLPWEDVADEAERLLATSKASRSASHEGHHDGEQENDQELERDETEHHNEVIFGRR